MVPLPGSSGRVTVLLVGLDNTHGDDYALTDTLIVASFDPSEGSLAMISLPRDTAHLPYYRGGTFLPRVNVLRQYAARDPASYPDGPMGTLVNEMSFLVGVPIDYYAVIGISGFSQLIDAVGGVDVNVASRVDDPGYQFSPTEIGFVVEPGWHHFDGKYGTAYARSRHGSSDYQRAARQQQLLLALRDKLGDPFVLTNLPQILDAVAQIIRTDAPLDRLPEIVSIALRSTLADARNIVLSPPRYANGVRTSDGDPTNMNELNMDALAQLSIELFGSDSRYSH
jgi:LCP family protein required for cell wall assembly